MSTVALSNPVEHRRHDGDHVEQTPGPDECRRRCRRRKHRRCEEIDHQRRRDVGEPVEHPALGHHVVPARLGASGQLHHGAQQHPLCHDVGDHRKDDHDQDPGAGRRHRGDTCLDALTDEPALKDTQHVKLSEGPVDQGPSDPPTGASRSDRASIGCVESDCCVRRRASPATFRSASSCGESRTRVPP